MFELSNFFNNVVKGSAKKDKKPGGGKSLLADSLKVSLILAVVIVLIIYFIFKDIVDEDTNFFSVMFKAGMFVLITVVAGVFIHSKHLEHVYEEKYADKSSKETVAPGAPGAEPPTMGGAPVQVQVNVNGKPVEDAKAIPKSGAFLPP
jgi:hypothetical protein